MIDFNEFIENNKEDMYRTLRELAVIPAPSCHEEKRAEYCLNVLKSFGAKDAYIDEALNVILPFNIEGKDSITIIGAHTDVVFGYDVPLNYVEKDGKIFCPGIGDDTVCVVILMYTAKYLIENGIVPQNGLIIVLDSGEEGMGNLKGIRQLMKDFEGRVKEFVTYDSDIHSIANECVGSHRYKVTVRTEGGHSFGAFGNRNAIHVLSSMICALYTVKVPQVGDSRTTYNVGGISGGTSVNTIAQNAEMLYEYRSDNYECLEKMRVMFNNTIEMYRSMGVTVEVELLGERPCGIPVDEEKMTVLRNRYLNALKDALDMEAFAGSSSTDCNIPLSMGIPAICFGVCRGSGCHTREEKLEVASLYDGCKLALQLFCNL